METLTGKHKTGWKSAILLMGALTALIGLPIFAQAQDSSSNQTTTRTEVEPLFQVSINSASVAGGGIRLESGRLTTGGVPLEPIIALAYGMARYRVVNNLPAAEKRALYKISVVPPKGREESLYPILQQALVMTFGLKIRREVRELDAWVLSVTKGKAASLRPSQATEGMGTVGREQILGQKQSLQGLAEQLGVGLNQPVVDETGLKGEYDWELPHNRGNNDLLITAVREKLGLELTKAKRQLEVLIIEKAESAKHD